MKQFKNMEYPNIVYNSEHTVDKKKLKVVSKKDIVEVPDELFEQYRKIPTLVLIGKEAESIDENKPSIEDRVKSQFEGLTEEEKIKKAEKIIRKVDEEMNREILKDENKIKKMEKRGGMEKKIGKIENRIDAIARERAENLQKKAEYEKIVGKSKDKEDGEDS